MSKFFGTLLASACLAGTTASAQTTFHFGVRAGGNLTRETEPTSSFEAFDYPTAQIKSSSLLAGQAGIAAEVRVGKLAFQPTLLFSQKGTKQVTSAGSYPPVATQQYDYFNSQTTTRTNWLELPLNFVYTPKVDHGFQLFAGPYVAVGLNGRQTGSAYQTSRSGSPRLDATINNSVSFGDGHTYRRLDYGFNAGLGYRLGPLQLQAGYGVGLRNMHDTYNRTYNRVAQLTATYFWGK